MSGDQTSQPTKTQRWQEGAIGLVLLALGAGIIFGTFSVSALPGQDSLGPRLFPALIGGGLMLLGLAHFRPAKTDTREGHADEGHWPSLLWMVGGLVLGALGYKSAGFIPAALAVFVLTGVDVPTPRPVSPQGQHQAPEDARQLVHHPLLDGRVFGPDERVGELERGHPCRPRLGRLGNRGHLVR